MASADGTLPMHWAGVNGHLEVCRWLSAVGGSSESIMQGLPLPLPQPPTHSALMAECEMLRTANLSLGQQVK